MTLYHHFDPKLFPLFWVSGHDPYEDSQIEFEDSTFDADEMVEEEGFAEEAFEGEEMEEAVEAGEEVALVPLMVVPWGTVPKTGIRPFCHFEDCKMKMSSKNGLSMHLANSHNNYVIDVSVTRLEVLIFGV